MAARQGKEGIRTQPSLEPGELEREVPFTAAGGQEEELGLRKDSEAVLESEHFQVPDNRVQTSSRHLGQWG